MTGVTWTRSPERSTWVAEHRNMLLSVSRATDGQWRASVTSDPLDADAFEQFAPRGYKTRTAAQRWCEQTAQAGRADTSEEPCWAMRLGQREVHDLRCQCSHYRGRS